LAYPEYGNWIAQTFLRYYRDNGLLGRAIWGGNEAFTMTGDSVTPLLAALANNGRAQFDLDEAYRGMRKNAFVGGVRDHAGYDLTGKGGGMDWYEKLGYVPAEIGKRRAGMHRDGSGMTLEYAYQDWCLAQVAEQLGKRQDAELFAKRSENWRNVFDTSVGWARPRHESGQWVEPFTPLGSRGFVESTPAVASYYVPHNLPGLIAAMGGKEAFIKNFEMCFEEAQPQRFINPKGYVDYSNQQSCEMANLLSYAGAPWKTQYWVRQVKELTFGGTTPQSGYNGDEDQGQMGALGVLMAIGLFNVQGCVGAEPQLEITSPLFDRIVLHTPDKTFEINVRRQDPAKDIYIQSARLNGKEWNSFQFPAADLLKGGTLDLLLGPEPDQKWGTAR
jgi:predicted alpha-1,2-mannosidase